MGQQEILDILKECNSEADLDDIVYELVQSKTYIQFLIRKLKKQGMVTVRRTWTVTLTEDKNRETNQNERIHKETNQDRREK